MPTSSDLQISKIIEIIINLRPLKLLDIGVGFGKYGFLAREYLDLFCDSEQEYSTRKHRIVGVEAYAPYITEIQRLIYDEIYLGNALDFIDQSDELFDLVLLIDVLEHFSYDDGVRLLKKLQPKAKNILISTPLDIGHQETAFGNVFETHIYQWKLRDFHLLGPICTIKNYSGNLIILMGSSAQAMRQRYKWLCWKDFLKNIPGFYTIYSLLKLRMK